MKKTITCITLIMIALAGCGKPEQKGQTTGTATPPPAQVGIDSIAPATPQSLADLMEHMAPAYNELGQKVEAGNFAAAQKAWETMVSNAKAILNFKADKPGPGFEQHQKDLIAGLDEIGRMITAQNAAASEKVAALSHICDACHKEYRK
jgi:cytochrome c556